MPSSFWIKDSEKSDVATYVVVGGRIGTTSAEKLRHHCQALLTAGHKHLVVDMSAVEFMASSGAGTLIVLSESFRASSGTVQIMRASDAVTRVIKLLNIDRFVVLVNNDEEVAANLQPHNA